MQKILLKYKIYFSFVIFFAAFSISAIDGKAQNHQQKHPTPKKKTVQKKVSGSTNSLSARRAVKTGQWGGSGIILDLQKDQAEISYDCADGQISQPLTIDRAGNFSIEGQYTARGHGPLRTGHEPAARAVIYEGQITGDQMSLNIISQDDKKIIGAYNLEFNREGKLHRCY